jgi:hypothetical protein
MRRGSPVFWKKELAVDGNVDSSIPSMERIF